MENRKIYPVLTEKPVTELQKLFTLWKEMGLKSMSNEEVEQIRKDTDDYAGYIRRTSIDIDDWPEESANGLLRAEIQTEREQEAIELEISRRIHLGLWDKIEENELWGCNSHTR